MLVLSRRIQETIVIGGNIRITVVGVGKDRVRIGIEAPANVRVDREEIHARLTQTMGRAEDKPLVVSARR
jgi:carbon storage regulator